MRISDWSSDVCSSDLRSRSDAHRARCFGAGSMCPRRLGSMRGNQGNTMEIKDPVRGFVAVLLLLSCLSTGGVEAAGQVPVESFVGRRTVERAEGRGVGKA